MALAFAMSCAFFAALCYGVASVAQAVAARRSAPRERVDPRLLADLLRQAPYVAGLSLDLLGFVATVAALHRLPLFFVQAAIASSVGVTALLAVRVLDVELRRQERLALTGLAAGLVMLAVAARPEAANSFSLPARVSLLCGVALVGIVGAIAGRQRGPGSAAALAVTAGLGFAGLGIAARALVLPHSLWRLFTEPLAWAIAGYGVMATLLFATALQRGSVTTAAALTFAVETVVPTAVGVLFLGDRARPSLAPLAAAGSALAVTGAISLARHAAISPQQPLTVEASGRT